jgi:hypothetical protein
VPDRKLTSLQVSGPSGVITADGQTVVVFGNWVAEDLPGTRRLRVAVTGVVNWNIVGRHRLHRPLVVRLRFGTRDLVGDGTVVRQEPLEFRLEDFS